MFSLAKTPDIEAIDTLDALDCLAEQLQNLLDLADHVARRYDEEALARGARKRKQGEDEDKDHTASVVSEPEHVKKSTPQPNPQLSSSYGDEGHPELAMENMNATQVIGDHSVDLTDLAGVQSPVLGGPEPSVSSENLQKQPEPSPRVTAYLNIARTISDMVEMEAAAASLPKKTPHSHLQVQERNSLTRTSSTTSLTTLLTTRGENDEPSLVQAQKLSIAKRFFLKNPPPLTIAQYLQRIHKYCPLSSSTYIAAGHYIYKICIKHHSVPFIPENAHRMVLAALRIACKVIEDLTYPHRRFSMAGGVSKVDLFKLEIAFLFLIDFDIKIDAPVLNRHMQKTVYIQRARDSCAEMDVDQN
ncbi:Cyclin-U1-1 [Yarrowia sp. E02]|nr:Cyclin-U1-1 [Yarrowia sp. E02]